MEVQGEKRSHWVNFLASILNQIQDSQGFGNSVMEVQRRNKMLLV